MVDIEDYEEEVTIKGKHGTELVTVALDAQGNIIGVFKGEHGGSLETVKLDSEHRLVARMLGAIELAVHKHTTLTAGSTSLFITSDAVPAGKLWEINNVVCYNEDGLTEYITLMHTGTHNRPFARRKDIPPGIFADWNGKLWLNENEYITAWLYGGDITGNTIILDIHGSQISES